MNLPYHDECHYNQRDKSYSNYGTYSMNKELPDINHKTVIFTKHARERLDLRRMNEDMIIQVMRKPNMAHKLDDGKIKFIGKAMGWKVHAICKPILEENKWLVISVMIRGMDDAGNFVNYRKYHGKNRDALSKFYITMIFWLIVFFAMIYYFGN